MEAQAALGAEDYQALIGMLTSQDASTRAQGQGLAKKLTPPEQREFFDFQQQANKGKDATSQRADSNMVSVGNVGVAPEDALVGRADRARRRRRGRQWWGRGRRESRIRARGGLREVRGGEARPGGARRAAGIADAAAIVVAGRGGKAPEVEAEAANPDLARIATKANRPNGAISPTPLRERFPNGLPVEHPGVLPPRVEPTASPASPVASAPAAPAPVVAAPAPGAPPVPPTAPPSPQSGTAAPSPSVPSPAAAALPDQRALNEAALAARRQAYQQRLAAQASAQVAETTARGGAGGCGECEVERRRNQGIP
jgi:hypothetical protein